MERMPKQAPSAERLRTMGSNVMLIIGTLEDTTPVTDLLIDRGITYIAFPGEDSPDTVVDVKGMRFEGNVEIARHIDEIQMFSRL